MSFPCTAGGACCRSLALRKLKSGNTKLAFGNLLCGPGSPDWRYKLLAQYHFNKVSACLAVSALPNWALVLETTIDSTGTLCGS